ncbi:hypothetical protein EVAR_10079_1 [Eumeta japonica]|uniref:Uncharacterized protein n=1 Tax=Eumeta variegata TaxID=151549 RepID=A0A4C1TR96_EUMVA|nr:hypothetical protein EVAR_10079_1 [Eumeta japonica]
MHYSACGGAAAEGSAAGRSAFIRYAVTGKCAVRAVCGVYLLQHLNSVARQRIHYETHSGAAILDWHPLCRKRHQPPWVIFVLNKQS